MHIVFLFLAGFPLLLAVPGAEAAEPVPRYAPLSHLGANLPAINDYSRTPVYVDLVHQARRFGSPTAPWDEKAELGSDGWPLGDFGVFLMVGQAGRSGSAGIYKVAFSGRATVSAVASSATPGKPLYDATRNRTTLDVVLADGADQLALAFTQTGSGIKNLQVIRPGYEVRGAPLFTREFIGHIARFRTLRFMDWLRTNSSPVTSWGTRASPLQSRYASPAGVPWEHIVALANQTSKDIWINIPVQADDDYVLQLARLLKSTLHPDRKIYVEYSNELWNAGFPQFAANVELALAELQAHPDSPLAHDGAKDRHVLAFRRTAKRTKEIGDIFRSVYGPVSMLRIVRPVLAGQVVQPHVLRLGLSFIETVYGPPSHFLYAVAVAPYYNMGDQQTVDGLTVDQVLKAMDGSVSRMPFINALEANVALARWHDLPLLAYEGGADTFGPGSIGAKKAANLDPRMQAICARYLSSWYVNGGDMFMWYTAGAGNWDTRYGAWGLTTDLAITQTPKMKCLDAMLATAPAVAKGRNEVPGTFNALAYVGNFPPYTAASARTLRYLHPASSVEYLVHAAVPGTYSLVITAEAGKAGNAVDVAVNAKTIATAVVLRMTGWGAPAENPPLALPLTKGFNTLRLTTRTETSGYALSSLTIR